MLRLSYMFRFCVKYWLKHINEFTIDEITKERDPELTGLGKKARGVSDVRTDILPLLKKEEFIEMISEQKDGIDAFLNRKRHGKFLPYQDLRM